jgi:hypothetical protein
VRQKLEQVVHFLAHTRLNHVILDLRQHLRESRQLDQLALLPEQPCLRTLTWDWPLGMLRRKDKPRTTPAASNSFLTRLLRELPLARHLTHLASSAPWRAEQVELVRSLGIEPIHAEQKLWMHSLPASAFQGRDVAPVSRP